MDDEISINLFCHSLGSRLRLLLRLVKVLLEFCLSGHAARDCRLGWCRHCRDLDLDFFSAFSEFFFMNLPLLSLDAIINKD